MAGSRYNEPSACRREKVGRWPVTYRVTTIHNAIPASQWKKDEEESSREAAQERGTRSEQRPRARERTSKEQKGTVQILVLSTSHFRSWPHSANGRPQAGANGTQLNDWYQRAPPVALAGMSRTRWQCRGCATAAETHRGPRLIRWRGEDESRKISAASNSISLVEGNGS